MKKILFFLESLAGGGAEKVLTDIVSNIDKTKYDVTVCTVTDEDIYQEKVRRACHYHSLLRKENYRAGGIRKILFWLKLKIIYKLPAPLTYRLFLHGKYDVEVAFIEGFATKIIAASCNSNSRKIAWVHTDMLRNKYADKFHASIDSHTSTYNRYSQIVCVSESVKTAFESKFSTQTPLCVQYNPVDEVNILTLSKEPIEVKKSSKIRLGTIGRLEQQKGYLRLLECMERLQRENLNLELWILGDGSQKELLQTFINKHNLSDNVTLWGFQRNPYKYIAHCDAFVCSSYAEGFSTAATESLILGKPIFTVNCAGMYELFNGLKCGEIVQNSDDALYCMLKQIASGEIRLTDYHQAVNLRSQDFKIATRIQEIEQLL